MLVGTTCRVRDENMRIARTSSMVFFGLAAGLAACWSPASAQVAPAADNRSAVAAPGTSTRPTDAHAAGNGARRPATAKQSANRSAPGAATAKSSIKIDTRGAARSAAATASGKPPMTAATGNTNASIATATITPNMRQNIFGPASPPGIEMGDRPARSTSLCGSGRARGFTELDLRTTAALLPEINGLQPRTICARRGVLIADYAFR